MTETQISASPSGTFAIGGDLPVVRLGYGAMQITGEGVWGPAEDPDEAIAVLRRTRRARRHVHRHRRLLRPVDSRGADQGGAAPVRRRSGHRDQGRPRAAGPGQLDAGRLPEYLRQQCEMSLRRLGVERIDLFQLHRIDPAVPLEDQVGGQGAAGRGQDPPHRAVRGHGRRDQGRPRGRRDRHRAEPLQPRRPQRRGRARLLRGRGHRLHPVVPARDRRAGQGGRPARARPPSDPARRRRSSRWPGCCAARR